MGLVVHFKFTRPNTTVTLRIGASRERVLIQVEDQCGGLPGVEEESENPRQSAELARAAAELARAAAEQSRIDAEAVRRGAVNELQATATALTVLIERMETLEAMRRAAGREN